MKKVVVFSLVFACHVNAQTINQGVYLSANDFENHKVSYQKQADKKYKFHSHENSNRNFVTLQLGDSIFQFSKDTIYGFVDKHHVSFRFYKREIYKILNPEESILLYSREHLGGYKGTQTICDYYFSKTAGGVIYKLTRHHLKLAFIEQIKFIELIDAYFSNDDELSEYDDALKLYKINALFTKSQNN